MNYELYIANSFVLILAALLDYLIGDPWSLPHPVQAMGWVISHLTDAFKQFKSRLLLRCAGIFLGVGLVTLSGVVGWIIVHIAWMLHELFGLAIESILLASCFAGHSLKAAAQDVLQHLEAGDISLARSRLSLYVGRDTQNLSNNEILRAVLETVTENATDAVMAPLFYAIAGAFVPFIGVVPLALAYKAASTLDSMVGYREAPYTDLGWFSARLEDHLTWLPCRLTVVTLALLSGKPAQVWRICRRDANKDPSPNSGWSECAYAALLRVQMGGTNWYQGVAKHKPLLGDAIDPITPDSIRLALQFTRSSFLIWLFLASMLGLSFVICPLSFVLSIVHR